MPDLAIIGSQDVDAAEWLDDTERVELPAGERTVQAVAGRLNGVELLVMPRNNSGRPVAPHKLDYRVNMLALSQAGVRNVLTTAMVGSLRTSVPKDSLMVVDQFIDMTKDRQFTFFVDDEFGFADMTEPYCPGLRKGLLDAAGRLGLTVVPNGCYLGVPGPRFETKAEVRMYGLLGGDVIGHTGTTDCIMAREAGICFATFAGVITPGAGLSDHEMNAELWHESRRAHAATFRTIVAEMAQELGDGSGGFAKAGPPCRCADAAPIEK